MQGVLVASPAASRRLHAASSASSPGSGPALQSPQSSQSAAACSDRSWALQLQPGANQFLMLVTAPGAAVSTAMLNNASADIILVRLVGYWCWLGRGDLRGWG